MILTRYLYNLLTVKHSLFLSILRHQEKETLFWICEIYYSGFEQDLEDLLINMYENCYCNNKIIKEYLRTFKKKIKCKTDSIKLCAYSTLAVTMCYHNFNLEKFCKTYFEKDVLQKKYENKIFKESLIEIKKENLKPFIEPKVDKLWMFLRQVCKYQVNNEYHTIFRVEHDVYEIEKDKLFNNWLYYCKDTPLWINRINEFKGILCEDSQTITFEDDEQLESFYQKYGYEPDEQPTRVIENLLGNSEIHMKNFEEFCIEFCLESNEPENTIKLNPLLNIKDNYFKIKSLEVLKEWFNNSHSDVFDIDANDNISICTSNNIILDFPIVNIKKKSIWNLLWKKIDNLLHIKHNMMYNSITEQEEKELKILCKTDLYIDFVVCLNEKTLIGIDIVYDGYCDVPREKIDMLKDYKVNNYYQVKAEWILSNYGQQENIQCKKLL
tara:strand:+ start:117 stop:1433 length:1317 start_codon:yes stop_codon:yes gene_type:complete